MKKCSMCFQLKPVIEYYNSGKAKDGKQNHCKECYKKYFDNWRAMRQEAPQTEFPQSKVCQDCGVERPISQFGKRSASKDKKMHVCKDCWRIQTKNALARHYQKKVKNLGSSEI